RGGSARGDGLASSLLRVSTLRGCTMCVREATRVRLLVALATVAGACANNDPRNDPTLPDGASDAATMPDGANSDGALQSDASDAGESCPDPSGGPPPGFSDLLTNCLP